jgi:hypothetical protein
MYACQDSLRLQTDLSETGIRNEVIRDLIWTYHTDHETMLDHLMGFRWQTALLELFGRRC